MNGRKTAAAETGRERLADAEGKAHGDSRVNGVAALAHDLSADLRDLILRGGRHCLGRGGVTTSGDAVSVGIDRFKALHRIGRGQYRFLLTVVKSGVGVLFAAGDERE